MLIHDKRLRRWEWLCAFLWLMVPIVAAAQGVPGIHDVADKLLGRSVDYLLLCVTLAANACTVYVVRAFITFVTESKKVGDAVNERHIAEIAKLHQLTRDDLRSTITATDALTDEVRRVVQGFDNLKTMPPQGRR